MYGMYYLGSWSERKAPEIFQPNKNRIWSSNGLHDFGFKILRSQIFRVQDVRGFFVRFWGEFFFVNCPFRVPLLSLISSQLTTAKKVLRVHFPHCGSVAGCIPGHNTSDGKNTWPVIFTIRIAQSVGFFSMYIYISKFDMLNMYLYMKNVPCVGY